MKHTFRGVVTAWLALIALQAVSKTGSGQVASFFTDVDNLVQRALSPNVPAIPDRRAGVGNGSPAFGITAENAAKAAAVARNEAAVGVLTDPNGLFGNGLSQYSSGGGLPAGIANNPALR
jgi:hypothetical protein